jgi:hypothetical protein
LWLPISSHTATWTFRPSSALASDDTGTNLLAVFGWKTALAPTSTPNRPEVSATS